VILLVERANGDAQAVARSFVNAMPTVRCSKCGQEHDLSRTEPTFWRPDALFSVPEEARDRRVSHNDDTCLIASTDGQGLTCFLRTVLAVPIKGEGRTIGWGVWVEVSDQVYQRVDELWEAPNQSEEPPLPCTLANEIPEYAGSRGLPGTIRLTSRPLDHRSSSHPIRSIRLPSKLARASTSSDLWNGAPGSFIDRPWEEHL